MIMEDVTVVEAPVSDFVAGLFTGIGIGLALLPLLGC
jgi:hypothetical protein